jgi:hypothetical protein
MNRFPLALGLVAAGLSAAPVAVAQEYASEPQPITLQGRGAAIDQTYTLPFGTSLDVIIAEFWVGVTVKLVGDAEFGLYLEGLSNLSWATDDGLPGALFHNLEPLANSGIGALKTLVQFDITFDVLEGGPPGSGRPLVKFPLVAQDIVFDIKGEPFTPFMLPGQTPASQTLRTRSADAAFEVPLVIPISLGGIATVRVGTVLKGVPVASATYSGEQLVTRAGDDIVQAGGTIQMYEPMPSIEMTSEYLARVQANIGYQFTVNLFFEIEVLGLFTFPINIPLFNQVFPLFSDDRSLPFPTQAYTHPLPMVVPTVPAVDFGEVEVGDRLTFNYLVNNDGFLAAEGLVGIDGDTAFSASPPEFFMNDGGQTSVVLTFEPATVGDFAGSLVLVTNDPYNETIEIPISGTGVLRSSDNEGDFGDDGGFDSPGSSIYSTCGCASSTWTAAGLAPFLVVVPLVARRRRR